MKSSAYIFPLLAMLASSGCVNHALPPEVGAQSAAVSHLREAGVKTSPNEHRACLYLQSASEAQALLGSKESGEAARIVYNKAAADLTVLLRTADQGRMWNRPLTLSSGGTTYRVRFAKGSSDGVWDPNYFTSFTPASEVPQKTLHRENHQSGFGGALVGVHKREPIEALTPKVGVTAPVTAALDFKGSEVTLTLHDPGVKTKARVAGAERPLEADFSAPLAYYPATSELWNGLMGAIRVSEYMGKSGLFMLQPYEPDRIPVIFVHGLISTPQMWRNVINELEADPTMRGRYQCGVFGYPTGNPPAYSALLLRQELAKFRQLHPEAPGVVLVGHSMGGLVSRMQATTVTRESWEVIGKEKTDKLFSRVSRNSPFVKTVTFQANPHVDRVVFICVPHRGSEFALSSIGELGRRLISLPLEITASITSGMGDALAVVTGAPGRMPNSVTGLSPRNPMLKVLDSRPIEAPYHSIIGDQGKGDSPNSGDGFVKYWSSHLCRAKSEKIVPGPHGACEMPETITELRRILHLHLKEKER
jgi:hypothetical protein